MIQHKTNALGRVADAEDSKLVEYLDVLIVRRWLIAGAVAVCTLLGLAYALLATPIYQADMLVQVDDSTGGASGASNNVVSQMSSLFDTKSTAAAEIEIIGSRKVVSAAVDQLQLYVSAVPKRFPILGSWISRGKKTLAKPGLLGMGGYAWGNESIEVQAFDVPPDFYNQPFKLVTLENGAYELSSEALKTPVRGRTKQPLTVQTDAGPLRLVVDDINALPGTCFTLSRASRLQTIDGVQHNLSLLEMQKPSGVISGTYPDSNPKRAADILSMIGDAYVEQNIDRRTEDAQKSLVFLDQQLPKSRAELEAAENNFSALRRSKGTVDLSDESRLLLQQGVDLQSQLLALQQKRQELALRFTPQHPSLRALDEQIATINGQIGSVEQRVRQLPTTQQDVVRLERDVKVKTTLYTDLLVSAQQLRLAKAGQVGTVHLIDTPVIPEAPIKPRRNVIVLLSAVGGLLIGIALAFAYDTLFTGVTDPNEIEERTGLNVYATIPESQSQYSLYNRIVRKQRGKFLLAEVNSDDPAVESLRSLRIGLQLAVSEAKNNIVLLTGPAPGIGKSFVSANLAHILASTGKRVLLLDSDMRKGYLNQYFGLSRGPGFADLLAGRADETTVLHRSVSENIDFITTGEYPDNPSELLSSSNTKVIIERLAAAYDIVICDAPPVLPVSDPGIVAPLAGVILLVARAGVTRVGEIVESEKRLAAAGASVTGVLFNGVSPTLGTIGSKYGSYRYTAYKYKSGDK